MYVADGEIHGNFILLRIDMLDTKRGEIYGLDEV